MVDVSVKQEGSFIDGTPPTSVTFGAGDPTVALEIATEDDDVGEDDGSITVTVTSVPSGIEISQTAASATVAVVDSPTATVPDAPTGLSATLGDQSGGFELDGARVERRGDDHGLRIRAERFWHLDLHGQHGHQLTR